MANIINVEPAEVQTGEKVARKTYQKKLAMLAFGESIGRLKKYLEAGALYDIKQQALWRLAEEKPKSWTEWCEKIGLSDTSARRALHVADYMKQKCIEQGEPEEGFEFSEQIIKKYFGESIMSGELTLKVIAESVAQTKMLNNFYDNNSDIPVSEIIRVKEVKQTPSEPRSIPYTSTYMLEFAEEHGLTWSGREWVNPDGSRLSDEQLAMLTHYEDGVRVWGNIEKELGVFLRKLHEFVEADGSAFVRYRGKGNKKFEEEVREINIRLTKGLKRVELVAHHLCIGDVADAVAAYNQPIINF